MFIIDLLDLVFLSIEVHLQPAGELIIVRYRSSDAAVKIIQNIFSRFLKLFLQKIQDPGEAFKIIVINRISDHPALPDGAELSLFCLCTLFGILIAAINTIANICVAPFVNAIGKNNGLHPHRRALILATTICSFPFFLPYGGCVLLLLGGLNSMMDTYSFLPKLGAGDMMFTAAKGKLVHLNVAMNSGMYKNAFTCGIPNSMEVGNVFAAALGYAAGDPEKGLESLADVTPADNVAAQKLIDEGKVTVELSGITSRIFIEATLETTEGKVILTIRDKHTNITKIVVNGETVSETADEHAADTTEAEAAAEVHSVHSYTLAGIVEIFEDKLK